jgi:hypothetical protein
METKDYEDKVLELPNWVKLINGLVKKNQLKSPKYTAEMKSNL